MQGVLHDRNFIPPWATGLTRWRSSPAGRCPQPSARKNRPRLVVRKRSRLWRSRCNVPFAGSPVPFAPTMPIVAARGDTEPGASNLPGHRVPPRDGAGPGNRPAPSRTIYSPRAASVRNSPHPRDVSGVMLSPSMIDRGPCPIMPRPPRPTRLAGAAPVGCCARQCGCWLSSASLRALTASMSSDPSCVRTSDSLLAVQKSSGRRLASQRDLDKRPLRGVAVLDGGRQVGDHVAELVAVVVALQSQFAGLVGTQLLVGRFLDDRRFLGGDRRGVVGSCW